MEPEKGRALEQHKAQEASGKETQIDHPVSQKQLSKSPNFPGFRSAVGKHSVSKSNRAGSLADPFVDDQLSASRATSAHRSRSGKDRLENNPAQHRRSVYISSLEELKRTENKSSHRQKEPGAPGEDHKNPARVTITIPDAVFSFSCIVAALSMVVAVLVAFAADARQCSPYRVQFVPSSVDVVDKILVPSSYTYRSRDADQAAFTPEATKLEFPEPSVEKPDASAQSQAASSTPQVLSSVSVVEGSEQSEDACTEYRQSAPEQFLTHEAGFLNLVDRLLGWKEDEEEEEGE